MNPAEEIRTEHRVIGTAMTSLLAVADAAGQGKQIPAELLRDELEFIKGFTEDCHHRKEEEVLFPALGAQLLSASKNPIPELIKEHEEGRKLMSNLRATVDAYENGDPVALGTISGLAAEYTALLLNHIRKENVVLIDLIENRLPANQKLEVAERFQLIEEDLGPEYHRKFEELAKTLHKEGRDLAA
jgi:hemerythrin-like domain-containing protein